MPFLLLIVALAVGFAIQCFSPAWLAPLFDTSTGSNARRMASLAIAFVISVATHEAGHLLAALLVNFRILGGSLGPIRITRRHGTTRFSFAPRNLFAGSVSAIPRDMHHWRLRMLAVVAAGPLATLVTGVLSACVVLFDTNLPASLRLLLVCYSQLNLFIFLLGLVPNGNSARVRNDTTLLLCLSTNNSYARDIYRFHLVAQLQAEGVRPRDYPSNLIEELACAQSTREGMLLYAETLTAWAMDSGNTTAADLWDRRTLNLSEACDVRLRSTALANSACLDLLIRNQPESAKEKLAQTELSSIPYLPLLHRAKATQALANGAIPEALTEISNARYSFPKRLPFYEFENDLLTGLTRLCHEYHRHDMPRTRRWAGVI